MSNVGKRFPSEMEVYSDAKTGRTIKKLTKSGDNFHLYFTENSFTLGDKEIIYHHSDTSTAEPGAKLNFFSMDLETGVRTQLTDFDDRFEKVGGFITKSPDSKYLVFVADGDLYCLYRPTGELRLLYRCPAGFGIASPTISHDASYVAMALNEKVVLDRNFSSKNYDGFTENFYGHKRSRIVLVTMDGLDSMELLQDTHWIGHVQFAPDSNEYLSYCHEGPWHMVQQRIWLLNTITRRVYPCFRQKRADSVGHEFWTRDGLIFFDNRGPGHDGTITVDKTQATVMDAEGVDSIPWVGFADKSGKVIRSLELPYYCNHYHGNKDNTKLVADAVNDIVLIDISTDQPTYEVLCEHNTSWQSHNVHCHPTWSWSNNKILFASDRNKQGFGQLYLIEME